MPRSARFQASIPMRRGYISARKSSGRRAFNGLPQYDMPSSIYPVHLKHILARSKSFYLFGHDKAEKSVAYVISTADRPSGYLLYPLRILLQFICIKQDCALPTLLRRLRRPKRHQASSIIDWKYSMERNAESSSRDADRVYGALRRKILTLNLDPGAALDESRIVEEMGTSRTPVREAVIRLISEGLLRRDGRQVRVSSFEVSQLRALFEGMTLMSRAIHRMAATRRSAQQLAVIRRMNADLNLGVEVIGRPIVRERDGLAMSSRNAYLSREERERATALWKALKAARDAFVAGEFQGARLEERARQKLDENGLRIDYAEVRDPFELQRVQKADATSRLFLAAFLGKTRLIDNGAVGEPG